MKLKWSTSIIIAFVLFIAFILFFVLQTLMQKKYDSELVIEEYYKHDAKYSDEMMCLKNTKLLVTKPLISTTNNAISIVFPSTFDEHKITGNISLYRPSNKILDFEVPISLSNNTLLIPTKSLVGGRWDITINWQYDGKKYLMKQQLYLE